MTVMTKFSKKIKIFQNLSFDCRIHIWQFFVHFSPKFFLLHSCFEFKPFLWVEVLKFSGKTIIIWPKIEKKIEIQIVICRAPLFRRLAKRHGETTGPNFLQASSSMSCRFQ